MSSESLPLADSPPPVAALGAAPKRRVLSDTVYSVLLITPAMILILIFALIPLAYAINVSFRFADLTSPRGVAEFVGLENYHFALRDTFFWSSVLRTLNFAVFAVAIEMVLGVAIAFLLHDIKWLKGLARSLIILPLAASPFAVGLIWRYMYHPEFGVFNYLISRIGLPEQNWLGNSDLAMASVIAFDVWQWTPFVALIALAGLQSLPKEPFEAAQLDGASRWRVLRTLTFPMLRPVLTLVLVLRTIDAVRLYDAVVSLTGGGPGTTTEVVTFYLYRLGLRFFRLDQASAMSLLFLYATVVFTGLVLRRFMREMGERTRAKN
ncbi:MAG: sugar ABC transporter permease [Chloroflexi bacterium]|nr:sugar ABC transporter permease [Chloroflexota bacterium]